jgi:hypothetical protein
VIAGWVDELLQDGGLKSSTAQRYSMKWDYFKSFERDIGTVILEGNDLNEIDNDFLLILPCGLGMEIFYLVSD